MDKEQRIQNIIKEIDENREQLEVLIGKSDSLKVNASMYVGDVAFLVSRVRKLEQELDHLNLD